MVQDYGEDQARLTRVSAYSALQANARAAIEWQRARQNLEPVVSPLVLTAPVGSISVDLRAHIDIKGQGLDTANIQVNETAQSTQTSINNDGIATIQILREGTHYLDFSGDTHFPSGLPWSLPVVIQVGAPTTTFPNGYLYRRLITIPAQPGVTGSVEGIPAPFEHAADWLKSATNGGRLETDQGWDVLFEDLSGSPLPQELEVSNQSSDL